jgi:uncharacterized integral membrane protein (TIGR00701 family)
MAGLLYLPRIFVYHVENKEKKEATDIFEVMEKKLFYYIMRPAMIFTWIFGLGSYLFKWDRNIFSTLDANKNCSSHSVVSL